MQSTYLQPLFSQFSFFFSQTVVDLLILTHLLFTILTNVLPILTNLLLLTVSVIPLIPDEFQMFSNGVAMGESLRMALGGICLSLILIVGTLGMLVRVLCCHLLGFLDLANYQQSLCTCSRTSGQCRANSHFKTQRIVFILFKLAFPFEKVIRVV